MSQNWHCRIVNKLTIECSAGEVERACVQKYARPNRPSGLYEKVDECADRDRARGNQSAAQIVEAALCCAGAQIDASGGIRAARTE